MMYIETKTRSIIKAISWRILATLTTMTLVYLFFHRLDLAAAVGVLEAFIKMVVYFLHERVWNRIKYGRKEIPSFVVWFTGLPLSGKTTIANLVYEKLKRDGIKVQRLDSKDVRSLFPEVGYTREERNRHIKRVGHLVSILEKQGVSTVASFISPYKESREFVRKLVRNFVEVYVKASVEACMKRDRSGLYERAIKGEIKNFTGISDVYEEPVKPDIVLDTEKISPEVAAGIVYDYLKNRFIKNGRL